MASIEDGATIADAGSASRERTRLKPVGFWSYSRQDDELSFGKLSNLRKLLMAEVQQQYGKERVQIFQDAAAIVHGAEWEREIRASLGDATFFIPIITPNFIQSEWCSREVSIFLEREQDLYRDHPDLPRRGRILPILLIDVTGVEPHDPAVLAALEARQWFDYSRYRLRSLQDEQVQQALSEFAGSIRDLLQLKSSPAPSHEERDRASAAQAGASARAEEEERRRKQAEAAAEEQRRRDEQNERERLAAEAAAAQAAAELAEARRREAEAQEAYHEPPAADPHGQEGTQRKRQLWPWLLLPVAAAGAAAAVLLLQPDSPPSTYVETTAPPAEIVSNEAAEVAPADQCETLWTQAGSADDQVAALRQFIATCPQNANLAAATTRLEQLTAPVVQPRRTDGLWSISWTSGDVLYEGTLSAEAGRAIIELQYVVDEQTRNVRQQCAIEGENLVSIRCSVLSGPDGYNADSFSLRFTEDGSLQGAGVDVSGSESSGVVLRRL
ncbi:MAG TPA: toll/interleukin-1 receptor domain-containing protein [Allosphingosinicella sp.]